MSQPEKLVVDYFIRHLKSYAMLTRMQLHIDNPPAGVYGGAGRPDLFIDFGPFHFRVEAKTEKGVMSARQDAYLERHRSQHALNATVFYGKRGADNLILAIAAGIEQGLYYKDFQLVLSRAYT